MLAQSNLQFVFSFSYCLVTRRSDPSNTLKMDKLVIMAVVVVAVLALVYWFWLRKKQSKAPSAPAKPAKPQTLESAGLAPPSGSKLHVSTASKIPYVAGQKWPDPASAGCSHRGGWGLITPLCGEGKDSSLIAGGRLKCTDQDQTYWYGCSQATKSL